MVILFLTIVSALSLSVALMEHMKRWDLQVELDEIERGERARKVAKIDPSIRGW